MLMVFVNASVSMLVRQALMKQCFTVMLMLSFSSIIIVVKHYWLVGVGTIVMS